MRLMQIQAGQGDLTFNAIPLFDFLSIAVLEPAKQPGQNKDRLDRHVSSVPNDPLQGLVAIDSD